MKSAHASIRLMAAVAVVSTVAPGCAEPTEPHAEPIQDTNDSTPDPEPAVDAGTAPSPNPEDAGSTSEPPADGGTAPGVDCSSFAPLPADMVFLPTGWMGDGAMTENSLLFVDCTIERASADAVGGCHEVTYAPPADGGVGWTGISWQNPQDYWEDPPEPFVGYPMPCGATKVSLYAKGAQGGEVVDFWAGNTAYQAKLEKVALTAEWQLYSMPFAGMPDDNVTLGFGFAMGAEAAGGPGASATFYIDDIKWE